jgi:hypothetical protein
MSLKNMNLAFDRRVFLRATGITLALPAMESLAGPSVEDSGSPARLVCIGNEFGMYPGAFWPTKAGTDYELPPLLKPLEPQRNDLTVFSHLDHGLKGGHHAVHTFLTGENAADARAMPDGGISLDQRAAEFIGSRTRFPALTIGSPDGLHGGCQMSWTRSGTRVPPIPGPRELFRALFVDNSATAKRMASDRIRFRRSILDAVLGEAKSLGRRLNTNDRNKLEEYFTSIRDVESKLTLDEQWQKVPKPEAPFEEPVNQGLAQDLPLIYDLVALALQTDSTRVATLEVGGSFAARDIGVDKDYHALSHHGMLQSNIDLLMKIELYQIQQFARFLDQLQAKSLLNSTMTLFGSGMGNANSHTNNDLPIVLAGGGFKHGEHKVYPSEKQKRVPLCNLYVSLLQQFGVDTDSFGNSTSTLTGLEHA